jgi:hypothetical protein
VFAFKVYIRRYKIKYQPCSKLENRNSSSLEVQSLVGFFVSSSSKDDTPNGNREKKPLSLSLDERASSGQPYVQNTQLGK